MKESTASLKRQLFLHCYLPLSFDRRPMQPLRVWFGRLEAASVTFTPSWSGLGVDPKLGEAVFMKLVNIY